MFDTFPKTIDDALAAGYRRMEGQEKGLQEFSLVNPCTVNLEGACSVTHYPDGSQKLCYCNDAGQCADCVIKDG